MQIKALIVQDRAETWFSGSRDERAVRIFTCLDQDTVQPMPNTFDYRPSQDELKGLDGKPVLNQPCELAVRSITPAKGGRLVMAGKILSIAGKPVNGAKSTTA